MTPFKSAVIQPLEGQEHDAFLSSQRATRVVIDEENPWPGLDAFDETAQRFFNGRRNESAELRRLVLNAPLTVLFGGSGLGKTSLIRAGLFPLVRQDNILPIYIHLDVQDRKAPLIDQVKFNFQAEISERRVDAPLLDEGESLWRYLHRSGLELWSERNELLTPLFVCDQFEEVFTLGKANGASIHQLRTDLADLIDNRLPAALADVVKTDQRIGPELAFNTQAYKVLLSFREDFLPAFEGWKREIPSILRNRLRLLPMSGDQAFEAVYATAPHLMDEKLARKIVRFVAAAAEEEKQAEEGAQKEIAAMPDTSETIADLVVEPALLSVMCHGLNDRRKAEHKPVFDEALLKTGGRSIISEYYQKTVEDLPDQVRRFIENELITEHGFRKPCDLDDAHSVHGVTDEQLGLLVDRRLLRIEPQHGTERVELTHDLLTRVVRENRDRQRDKEKISRQQKEQAQKRKRLLAVFGTALLIVVAVAGILAAKWQQRALIAEQQARIAEQKNTAFLEAEHEHSEKLKKADTLHIEGNEHLRKNEYDGALLSFRDALHRYENINESQKQASTLVDIGDVLALKGSVAEAETTYLQAMGIATGKNHRDVQGRALESLAALNEGKWQHKQERARYHEQALTYYNDAKRVYQDAGDYQSSGRILERLASDAEDSSDFVRAADLYRDALNSYNLANDKLGKLRVQRTLKEITWGFGYLVDLLDGKEYRLKGKLVDIGRDTESVKNDISFSNQLVSRRHVAISSDLQLDDLRSSNGTTINARTLPYGIGAKLSDKDIIVLANVEPLQFRTEKPSVPLQIPPNAWAVLIDGQSKSYRYLTGSEYSMMIENGKLTLRPGSLGSAVVKLRGGPDKPEMLLSNSEWKLSFTLKETDYEYRTYLLKDREWGELYDVPMSFVQLTPDGKRISTQGPTFQIVFFKQPS